MIHHVVRGSGLSIHVEREKMLKSNVLGRLRRVDHKCQASLNEGGAHGYQEILGTGESLPSFMYESVGEPTKVQYIVPNPWTHRSPWLDLGDHSTKQNVPKKKPCKDEERLMEGESN